MDILPCPDSQITLTLFNICLISASPTAWLHLGLSDLPSLNSLSVISVFLLLHTMVCEQCYHSLVHPYAFLCTLIAGSVGMCCLLLFSCQVRSDSLWVPGMQYTRLLCPSLCPGVCPDSCLLSRWCHPTVSSSVVPFSSCPQSFPASGSFPVGQFFASGGQSIVASASASVLPVNIQGWSPLGWTGLISFRGCAFKISIGIAKWLPHCPRQHTHK